MNYENQVPLHPTGFRIGDAVIRAANSLLHIPELTGVIRGFWRVGDDWLVQVCAGPQCVLTGAADLRAVAPVSSE